MLWLMEMISFKFRSFIMKRAPADLFSAKKLLADQTAHCRPCNNYSITLINRHSFICQG